MKLPSLILGAAALLIASACGGRSSDSPPPPSTSAFTLLAPPVPPGAIWELNRPVDFRFSREVDFSTVGGGSIQVRSAAGGSFAVGSYGPAEDPATGEVDRTTVRFQPACPTAVDGSGAGFEVDTAYRITVFAAGSGIAPVRAVDGTLLEVGYDGVFTTPAGSDPRHLFHDTVPGPPRPLLRGRDGVGLLEPDATHFDLGDDPAVARRVYFEDTGFGTLTVSPNSVPFAPEGLPLNHHVDGENRVRLVLHLDQQVAPDAANLERVGLEHLSGGWKRLPGYTELVELCGERGSVLRFVPQGTLPPGGALRLRLDEGFRDITGDPLILPTTEVLPVSGTRSTGAAGSRVDAIWEPFLRSGDEPGSMEDTTSDLGAPRAFWGSGFLSGVDAPGGLSRARSRWFPVGLAGREVGMPIATPDFSFSGTDAQGDVRAAGGFVLHDPPVIGPLSPAAILQYHVDLSPASLAEPTGLYAAQPALLTGDRMRLTQGISVEAPVFGVSRAGSDVRSFLGVGCYAPGYNLDCVTWDLGALFSVAGGAGVDVRPRSFDVYSSVFRDRLNPDHRVTIRFDATFADADGQPDELAAFSTSAGWTPLVDLLSGTPWDFIRFEVEFDVDVSGDGWDPLERAPVIDFIKIPVDLRD